MTKSEQRKARQTAHADRDAARLAAGDTSSARDRHDAAITAAARAARRPRRRKPATRQPIAGSAEWAETRGDDLGESPDY